MTNDLISVIIPAYQAEKTIEACLKTVCRNTYKNLEIIVVLRECGDNSLKIINSIADNRIKVVFQEENTGPGGARNIGLKHATGKWVCFAESDDLVSENFYSSLLEYIKKYDADIAWGEIYIKGRNITRHGKLKVLESFKDKFSLITNGASFDKMFRKSFLDNKNILFMESVRYEDSPFLFRAFFYAKRIVTVPGIKYFYQPSEYSEEYKRKLKGDVIPVATDIISFFKSFSLKPKKMILINKKILASFASGFTGDQEIYRQLKQLMGDHFFLRWSHLKRVIKQFRREQRAKLYALLAKFHLIKQEKV